MASRTRCAVIATGPVESCSRCFYGNKDNRGHDGPSILGDGPNSIMGEMII